MDGVQDISDRQLLIALKSREQQSERNNELIAFTAWLPAQQTPDTGVGGDFMNSNWDTMWSALCGAAM